MIEYMRIGFGWFLGTAIFATCWCVLIALIGFFVGLVDGEEDGDDE